MLYSHFIGRVGKDGAKILTSKKGDFLTMDVATDFFSKGENQTMWVQVKSNKSQHINLGKHLTKGKLILIEGTQLLPQTWIGKDGEAHAQITIFADSINFVRVGKKKEGDVSPDSPVEQPAVEQAPPFPAPENQEDLPF